MECRIPYRAWGGERERPRSSPPRVHVAPAGGADPRMEATVEQQAQMQQQMLQMQQLLQQMLLSGQRADIPPLPSPATTAKRQLEESDDEFMG